MTSIAADLCRVAPVVLASALLLTLCTRLCRWELPPTEWSGGRAGWHVLPVKLAEVTGSAALKLKGLGQAPVDGVPAQLPGPTRYDRWHGQAPDPHFGIRADTEFCLIPGDPAPVGGLMLTSALCEFDCATALQRCAVPAVRPIAVFKYAGHNFTTPRGPSPLGISLTGSPLSSPLRCSVALPNPYLASARAHTEVELLARRLNLDLPDVDTTPSRLAILAEAYRRFGTSLHDFSLAGWFRYSGHPDNVVVDDAGRAVLVDLDSCREMDSSRPDLAAMEAVRDGMSALYNLACSFFKPAAVDTVIDDDLLDHEPFSAFLDGWDPDTVGQNALDGEAIARYVIASRRQLRHFGEFLRSPSPAGGHLYRYVRHDRDLTFIWLYRMAWMRRLRRPDRLELPFGLAELDQRLLRFAGRERFGKMTDLDRSTTRTGPL